MRQTKILAILFFSGTIFAKNAKILPPPSPFSFQNNSAMPSPPLAKLAYSEGMNTKPTLNLKQNTPKAQIKSTPKNISKMVKFRGKLISPALANLYNADLTD